MKTFGIVIVTLIGLAVLGAGAFYIFAWRPSMNYWNENKQELAKKADEFALCLLEREPRTCREDYMTVEAKQNVSPEQIDLLANMFKTKLGKRKGSTLDEGNFQFNKKSGRFWMKFSLTGEYDQDSKVKETYVFVKEPDGKLLVHELNFNSNALLK